MPQNDFLSEVVARLEAVGVAYAITGSIASNYWGVPRLTHDIDVVVILPAGRVTEVVAAFADRYYVTESAAQDAVRTASMFNVIDSSEGFKADLWTPTADEFTQALFSRRRRVELLPGVPAFVGSPEDVLLHKLVWNRLTPSGRQIGDAAGIAAMQAGHLDYEYLKVWAAKQGTSDTLQLVLEGKGLKAT